MVQADKKIVSFWNWFKNNEDNLKPDKINEEFINILNEKILNLGDFSWEISEGSEKENMFVISPGGDVNLLKNSRYIISKSPKLFDWEFYHYKPAKKWDYRISIYESATRKIIDVSNWEYVLYKFQDHTFDVLLKADNIAKLSTNEKFTIADIVLESILGEEESLTLIKNIEFVDEFDKLVNSSKSYITHLKDHFQQIK